GDEVTQGWMRVLSSAAGDTRWLAELQRNSTRFGSVQAAYFEKQTRLWTGLLSGAGEQVAAPAPGDRRFSGKEWRDNPYFNYLRQSYQLASGYLEELVESCELEPFAKDRVRFAARQWIDALSPANFAATNPAVLGQAMATQGESLTRGLANLLGDVQKKR